MFLGAVRRVLLSGPCVTVTRGAAAASAKAPAKAPPKKAAPVSSGARPAAAGAAGSRSVPVFNAVGMPTAFTPKNLKTNLLRTVALEEIAQREAQRPIPFFCSGSIVKVTYFDSLSEKYPSKLVGIVVSKKNAGLGSSFIVRNVIQEVALQKYFHSYSPLIQSIEVLRLCRRRRAKLFYLRDRPLAESTFSMNMVAEPLPTGPIPVEQPPPRVRGPSGKPGRKATPEEVARRRAKRAKLPIWKDPMAMKRVARRERLQAREARRVALLGKIKADRDAPVSFVPEGHEYWKMPVYVLPKKKLRIQKARLDRRMQSGLGEETTGKKKKKKIMKSDEQTPETDTKKEAES